MSSAMPSTLQSCNRLPLLFLKSHDRRVPCGQSNARLSLFTKHSQAVSRVQSLRLQTLKASAGGEEPTPSIENPASAPADEGQLGPRDDDVLPDSLTDALKDASDATSRALESGIERCVVEVLLPEFWDPASGPVYAEEGDQQRFWKLTRRYLDNLATLQPEKKIRAVYPDVGVAAMLKNQWTDVAYQFASLNDRRPVAEEDDIVVLAAPDPQGLDAVIRISGALRPGQVLVMFNPRLASGDVGVGLNVRRMYDQFLSQFTTTYSLRPVGDVGSVFRRFPGMWQVFVQDEQLPGRYRLAAERASRPSGEVLDIIIVEALGLGKEQAAGEGGEGLGLFAQVGVALKGLNRFMRQLSQ